MQLFNFWVIFGGIIETVMLYLEVRLHKLYPARLIHIAYRVLFLHKHFIIAKIYCSNLYSQIFAINCIFKYVVTCTVFWPISIQLFGEDANKTCILMNMQQFMHWGDNWCRRSPKRHLSKEGDMLIKSLPLSCIIWRVRLHNVLSTL